MRTKILAVSIWLVVGCSAMAQATNSSATNGGTYLRGDGSVMRVYEAPLITLRQPVVQTNLVAVPVDKLQNALTTIQNYLTGALTVIGALLAWWGQNRAKVASLVPVLVKSVQTHGSPELKAEIKDAAGSAGVEPALNAAVKANTTDIPKVDDVPPKPTVITGAITSWGIKETPPPDPTKLSGSTP